MKKFGVIATLIVASCISMSAQKKPSNVTVGKALAPSETNGTGTVVQPSKSGKGTAVKVYPMSPSSEPGLVGQGKGSAVAPVPVISPVTQPPTEAVPTNVNAKLEIIGGDTFDWKKVKPKDTPLKAKIQIINRGTELLKISEVRPGCGCTAAPIDKKELQPLVDTATIEVSLNLGSTNGPLNKSITIQSNDGTTPAKVLYLKADVIREINITPSPYFAFRDMVVGKVAEASVRIENNSLQDLVIQETTLSNGIELNIKTGTIIKSKTQLEVVARVTPKEKGYFTATAKIATSNPDYASIDMTAYGNVKEAEVSTPSAK